MVESSPRAEGCARGRVHPALVAALGACTLWLIAQNLILFALAPWHHLPIRLSAGWLVLPVMCVGGLALALVPFAFALGWASADRRRRSAERRPA